NEPMPINLPMEEQIDFMYEHMILAECNQAFMQMYGYTHLAEVIGKSQLELHGGSENPENRKALRDFITAGFRTENIETTEPDLLGNTKYFSNNSVGIIENGYLVRTWGTQTDITERKATEIELIKFLKAVEQSPVSIMITNMEGAIEYANPKVSEITGYQKEELIGKNPRIFNSREQDSLFYDHLWNTISSGKDWTGEFHNKKKNGELFWEHASISPILNEKGEITHYLAFKEDITKRKQAEKALKESMLNL
ncbi:MAG: PAS domain S-box protein, partial [Bacteroidales bacterium]|nr:PAS domain S-box protein [Bacteroidales bacterium]